MEGAITQPWAAARQVDLDLVDLVELVDLVDLVDLVALVAQAWAPCPLPHS